MDDGKRKTSSLLSYKSSLYEINQIRQIPQTPKESDPYLISYERVLLFFSNPISCATLQIPMKPIKPQNFPIPPNSISSQSFPPFSWANRQNSSVQHHFYNQPHSPVSMEPPLNPFFPFPFDLKTGFSILLCKPLVKI